MNRLGIVGSSGRMGVAIRNNLSRFIDSNNPRLYILGEDINEFIRDSDYIVDFSSSFGTELLVKAMLDNEAKPLLIGTTAISDNCKQIIGFLSKKIPVMEAPNVSIGANLQALIAEKLAAILGEEYDPEIIDIHHKEKKDAPSGTALMLAQSINSGFVKNGFAESKIVISRANDPIRETNEIAISSIRAGNITGEHIVSFFGEFDSLTISHKVENRDLLAISAIKAILWLKDKKPGKYYIRDMISF